MSLMFVDTWKPYENSGVSPSQISVLENLEINDNDDALNSFINSLKANTIQYISSNREGHEIDIKQIIKEDKSQEIIDYSDYRELPIDDFFSALWDKYKELLGYVYDGPNNDDERYSAEEFAIIKIKNSQEKQADYFNNNFQQKVIDLFKEEKAKEGNNYYFYLSLDEILKKLGVSEENRNTIINGIKSIALNEAESLKVSEALTDERICQYIKDELLPSEDITAEDIDAYYNDSLDDENKKATIANLIKQAKKISKEIAIKDLQIKRIPMISVNAIEKFGDISSNEKAYIYALKYHEIVYKSREIINDVYKVTINAPVGTAFLINREPKLFYVSDYLNELSKDVIDGYYEIDTKGYLPIEYITFPAETVPQLRSYGKASDERNIYYISNEDDSSLRKTIEISGEKGYNIIVTIYYDE